MGWIRFRRVSRLWDEFFDFLDYNFGVDWLPLLDTTLFMIDENEHITACRSNSSNNDAPLHTVAPMRMNMK